MQESLALNGVDLAGITLSPLPTGVGSDPRGCRVKKIPAVESKGKDARVGVEDDYLASRGYPMSSSNRIVVRQKMKSCPDQSRSALFRCLDRLLSVFRA